MAVQQALPDLLVEDLLGLPLGVGGHLAAQLGPGQGAAFQGRAQQVGDVSAHAAVPVAVLLAAVLGVLVERVGRHLMVQHFAQFLHVGGPQRGRQPRAELGHGQRLVAGGEHALNRGGEVGAAGASAAGAVGVSAAGGGAVWSITSVMTVSFL